MRILIKGKFVDKIQAEKLFFTSFDKNRSPGLTVEKDPLARAMEEAKARGFAKTGIEQYVDSDDLVDIHRWREKLRKDKTNYWA